MSNYPWHIGGREWAAHLNPTEISARDCEDQCCSYCMIAPVWMSREDKWYSTDCLVEYWSEELEAILRGWFLHSFDEAYADAYYIALDDNDEDDFDGFVVFIAWKEITVTLAELENERAKK